MLRNYPLTWPDGWQRTPASLRKHGHFNKKVAQQDRTWKRAENLTISDAVERVLDQLGMMDVSRDDSIISTNVPVRLDGLPKSSVGQPADPGAAVYWRAGAKGVMQTIAIDIYWDMADNLAAIAATLEAMRTIARHGGAQVQERAFRGFAALPSSTSRPWRDVLGIAGNNLNKDLIIEQYRSLARARHPDSPHGSHEAMAELNAARDEALKELQP